jgi:putative transposase
VIIETSKLDIPVPRDREGTFDPKSIARYQRLLPKLSKRDSEGGLNEAASAA